MNDPIPEVQERPLTPQAVVERHLEEGRVEEAADLLSTLHEADGGEILVHLDRPDQEALVRHLPPENLARLLEELDIRDAMEVVTALPLEALSPVLDRTSADVAADVLRVLPKEQAVSIVKGMVRGDEVAPLLEYRDDTAGGLMVPEFVVLREWMTAEEAIAYLRGTKPKSESSNYLFVLDRKNALSGVVSLRDLVLAPAQTPVRDLMDPSVVTVTPEVDQEECARLLRRYDLGQLPVVGPGRQVLGVILGEDLMDVMEEEATEDMLALAAIRSGERALSPFRLAFRKRLPWLVLNLGTVLMAATVISIFEPIIAAAAFLAVFLPMVASQGGIAGSQTLTLVTRGLGLGELSFTDTWPLLRKEMALGLANGAMTGLFAGVIAWLWKGEPLLGMVVGVAIVMNLVVAGLAGALVPLLLKAMRLDPALGSVVIVTTFTDMAGFGFVLLLAALWLV